MQLWQNPQEERLRSGWRILIVHLILFLMLGLSSVLLPLSKQLSPFYSLIIIFGVIGYFGTLLDRRSFSDYGLAKRKGAFVEFIQGFLVAGIVMGIMFGLSYFNEWTVIRTNLASKASVSFIGQHLYYLVFMLSVGFYEEFWTRSYLLLNLSEGFSAKTSLLHVTPTSDEASTKQTSSLISRYGLWAVFSAVGLSSAVFAFLHAGNPNVSAVALLNIFLAGVMLALPFVRTGALWMSCGIHAGWNYFQGGVFSWAVSGTEATGRLFDLEQVEAFDWLHGGDFGPEGGLLGTFGIVLIVLWCLRWVGSRLGAE